ncbi:MAG: conjugal transfer protein TrbM [Achromobacter sp.]|uniref:TrbM/KikA/MpfK family conjugal transfer protein n=2 Tax=Alcaligenaceae TaxID=506 RepID=UPI000F8F8E4E|nr:TrbM/KikA/MpfK family conjugal transfer protein [Achromobacter spanius]AZS77418.1 conjugal transfer protein TrbM [Achromobacter spanius]MPS81155.1 conjugal transfer protein TrbM [Achromobacter sp.]
MPAHADGATSFDVGDVMEGDKRLACEAILCLSSGTRPSECAPSLSRYFGINMKKLSDTLEARRDFLSLCPASGDSKEMSDLVRAISQGAGRCDAAALNVALRTWRGGNDDGSLIISDKRPGYCNVYTSHEYTAFDDGLPLYVGTPAYGGYWVEPRDYQHELAKYEKALAERKEREQNGKGPGFGMVGN